MLSRQAIAGDAGRGAVTNELVIDEKIRLAWVGKEPFNVVRELHGEVVSDQRHRRTVKFRVAGRNYFAKLYFGKGRAAMRPWQWAPMLVAARDEYRAARHLRGFGLNAPRPVAHGTEDERRGERLSFVVSEALDGYSSIAVVTAGWQNSPPAPRHKQRLVESVAILARQMHGAGVTHRDFDLDHIWLDDQAWARGRVHLALIDVHRVRIGMRVSPLGVWRDLGTLLANAWHLPLTHRDRLRFVRLYANRPLREALTKRRLLWWLLQRRVTVSQRTSQPAG